METPAPINIVVQLPKSLGLRLSLLAPLASVRTQYPAACIVGLTEGDQAANGEPHPEFDIWIELPEKWPRRLAALWSIHKSKNDLYLHARTTKRSNPLAFCVRAQSRIRIGRLLDSPAESRQRKPAFQQAIDDLEAVGFLAPAGISHEVCQGSALRVRALRQSAHLLCPYVVLHAGSRRYAPDRFGKVARYLGENLQIPSLIIWQGKAGRSRAEAAVASSGGHGWLAPPTSLSDTAELIRQAELALSCDRDLLDIAAAQQVVAVDPLQLTKGRSSGENAADIPAERVAIYCERRLAEDLSRRSQAA